MFLYKNQFHKLYSFYLILWLFLLTEFVSTKYAAKQYKDDIEKFRKATIKATISNLIFACTIGFIVSMVYLVK